MSNFVNVLMFQANKLPNKKAYIFLKDGKTESASLTYQELDSRARSIAAHLQFMGLQGEKALLLYPSGLEFIAAFFGCLYAGVVPVPLCTPRRNQTLTRLQAVVADAGAKVALTNQTILENLEKHFVETPDLKSLYWWATDKEQKLSSQEWQKPQIDTDDLCFLQYTSGSTGKPKGVMVTHRNLLANSKDLDLGWDHTSESVIVTWLPTFHDMGLIYGVLQPLYKGIPCYMMAPATFLQSPVRWLEAISRYRGTHTAAPSFAYELCVNKITEKQKADLDLTSWKMALNGAEPVRAEVMQDFIDTFSSCGFHHSTFCPGYGLAEATLKVTAVRATQNPTLLTVKSEALKENRIAITSEQGQGTQTLVGCGFTEIDTQITIVNPDNFKKCAPDEIGEIWVSGSTVAQGYWKNEQQTQETFKAYTTDTKEGPFLRTGDLGFIKDGELFVTGRLKDVMIIRGANHYPQDIELTVQNSHEALILNHSAAFITKIDGEDKLIVASEVERRYRVRRHSSNSEYQGEERRQGEKESQQKGRRENDLNPAFALELEKTPVYEEIVHNIRQSVSRNHGLQVHKVCLIRFCSIPKTSSGKIQRHACRKGFLENNLNIVYESK